MADDEVPSRLLRKRTFPDDSTREIFEAAKSGDAVVLTEVLQQMNVSERASTLERKTAHDGFQLLLNVRRGGSFQGGWAPGAREGCRGESTPLIVAAGNGNLDCVKVLLQYKANIESRGHIIGFAAGNRHCTSPLVAAAGNGHVEVLSCLVENGADVNAQTDIDNCTALMIASLNCQVNAVAFLIKHGANISLQDKNGDTALHYAARHKQDTGRVVGCLIESGADVDACSHDSSTPLMLASCKGHVKVVTFLTEYKANIDLQNKDGNTALHFAVSGNSRDVVHELLSFGATQLYNNKRLTPLLLASNKHMISMVEYLINRLEFTKEQRIDALELLGASLATMEFSVQGFPAQAYGYMKRGMEERFQDPLHPLTKQPMEPVEAYQNRRESQTLEELAGIDGESNAILMESLIILERILGQDNSALVRPIQHVANKKEVEGNFDFSIALHRHAMEVEQRCDNSGFTLQNESLNNFISVFCGMVRSNLSPRQEDIIFVIERIIFEYERQTEKSLMAKVRNQQWNSLLYSLWRVLKILANLDVVLNKEGKNSCVSVLLQKLICLNPCDAHGNALLHLAVKGKTELSRHFIQLPLRRFSNYSEPCPKTLKLLLNAGFSVNAINNDRDTPLHRAVHFKPSSDKIHLLTEILQLLFDRGAHHDFVNNDDKTAMDVAQSDEARSILSEKERLELKCISARAVKKSGLPYLGVVPKTLEKFISMH